MKLVRMHTKWQKNIFHHTQVDTENTNEYQDKNRQQEKKAGSLCPTIFGKQGER